MMARWIGIEVWDAVERVPTINDRMVDWQDPLYQEIITH